MSIPHIMLVKWHRAGVGVEYGVECRDFNPDTRWDVVGSVILMPEVHIYSFNPTAIWRKKRVLPPHLYGLEQRERVAEIRGQYRGFGFGAWGEAVHQCAIALMRERLYPERLAYRWDVLWWGADQQGADKGPSASLAPSVAHST
jgi:hypothetical protein